jgi:F-type H+-transporting ATPase subunit delta
VTLGGSAARRYAEAMLDIAVGDGKVADYRDSFERLARGLGPAALRALRDPSVPAQRRVDAVAAVTKGEAPPMAALLQLLVRRGRIALLPDIARAFGELVDRREGIAKARITTALELGEEERRELVARLEQASGKRIRATFGVDRSLIGGARVQVGDHLVDASIRSRLDALRTRLAGS